MLDPALMSYNAGWPISHPGYDPTTGCIDWPEQDWPAFERRLAMPASEQGYFYVQDDQTGEFLGHVHYEVEPDGTAHIGLNVVPSQRGNGLGTRFMDLLLEQTIRECVSGRELAARGFVTDIAAAVERDSSANTPILIEGAFALLD
jgi:RimJ/RimL family protein N-acetyltransferase